MRVTADTNLADLAAHEPAAKYLYEEWDLHCVSCILAGNDTLKNGMQMHGYDAAQIAEAITELNALLKKDDNA